MKHALFLIAITSFVLAGCQDEESHVVQSNHEPIPQQESTFEQIDEHNASNALDWNGTYIGLLPCADCAGIETRITLYHDSSYQIEQTYLGHEDGNRISEGQLSWNDAGNTITLVQEPASNQYFVGENMLLKLDVDGQKVKGDLAEHYQLKKQ